MAATKSGKQPEEKANLYRIFVLLLITAGIYSTSLINSLVNWDDVIYITENSLIQSLSWTNISGIFSASYDGHYSPLTLLSLMADNIAGGGNAWLFHLTSMLLHLINTLLVLKFVLKLTRDKWAATIAALLFSLHPINTEAVVWASGRKDVLFAFFFLVSLIYYLSYLRENKGYYLIISLIAFLFSALAKEQAVSLAISIILIDFVEKRNLGSRKVILEKLPFLAVAFVFGILSIYAQKATGYIEPLSGDAVPLVKRFLLGSYGLIMYLFKVIVPANQSAFYPYPFDVNAPIPAWFWIFPILFAGFFILILFVLKKQRVIGFALLFFVVNIFLMLRFMQANPGDIVIAERYLYVPAIGLFMIAGIGFSWLIKKKPAIVKTASLIIMLLAIIYGTLSIRRITVWKDSITLLNDILIKHPNVYTALNCRGDILASEGKYDEALLDFTQAININPYNDRSFSNRGLLYAKNGSLDLAMKDFDMALRLDPKNFRTFNNRGVAYEMKGDFSAAMNDYNMALSLNPSFAEAWVNRGNTRARTGDIGGAMNDYSTALELRPGYPKAHAGIGLAYNFKGDFKHAISELDTAIALGFVDPLVYFERGYSYYNLRDFKAAIRDFTYAISLKSNMAKAYAYRGFAWYNTGDYKKCTEDLTIVLSIGAGDALVYGMRGMAYLRLGEKEAACADLLVSKNLGNTAAIDELEKNCGIN